MEVRYINVWLECQSHLSVIKLKLIKLIIFFILHQEIVDSICRKQMDMSKEIVQYFQYLQSLLNKSPINIFLLCLDSFTLSELFFVALIFSLCFWGFALGHIVFEYSKFSFYELLNDMIEWFCWYCLYVLTHCTFTLLCELDEAIFSCASWHINFVFYGEVYCECCWWESKPRI